MRLDVEASEEDHILLRAQMHGSKARSKGSTFFVLCVVAKINVGTLLFLYFFHRRVFLLFIFAFVFFHVFFFVFHFSFFIWPKGLCRLFDSATHPLASA